MRMRGLGMSIIILVVCAAGAVAAADFSNWAGTNDPQIEYRWRQAGDGCYLEYRDSTVNQLGKGTDIEVRVTYKDQGQTYTAPDYRTRIIYLSPGNQNVLACEEVTQVQITAKEAAK